jgi:hypothetical protein
MIEPIFDELRSKTGNCSSKYLIYGHSAGAQFVQRFIYFIPKARYQRAVVANAGWYMLADFDHDFPYGLKGSPVSEANLRAAFERTVVVLLGEADIDSKHRALRHSPEAEAQGAYRFARGQYFFRQAKASAEALHAPFHWSLATAPGIAHSDRGMAPFAVAQLFPN